MIYLYKNVVVKLKINVLYYIGVLNVLTIFHFFFLIKTITCASLFSKIDYNRSMKNTIRFANTIFKKRVYFRSAP